MLAEDKLRQGDLRGCLAALQDQVRAKPADASLRVFLFQLLSVMGNWERALTQLNVAGELDSQNFPMVQAYREALRCEALRSGVFAGERKPLVIGEPERWVALFLEAMRLSALGRFEDAMGLQSEAAEAVPEISGVLNGQAFEAIADGDSRVGPFLEAIVNGGYYWVPFSRVSRLEIDEPRDLRDFVWAPATFTWANGGTAVGFVPSRYPGTAEDTEDAALLCRRTEWRAQADEFYFGVGQRVLFTDRDEYSLLDVRLLEINQNADTQSQSTDE